MLFRNQFLDGIRTGAVTLAFRRWRKPTVRAGGTLLTPVGQLDITSIEIVALSRISVAEAHRAGYGSKQELLDELQHRTEGDVYRIEFGALRPDPRIALRENVIAGDAELRDLRDRIQRLDARASEGPWTVGVLHILREHPGVRAGDLCVLVGMEKDQFKLNVRKLKNLGLTESLETGYRLSPRGEALLASLQSER